MGGWRWLVLCAVGCHATPSPPPVKSCVPGPITLTIPWVPPSVGETLHFTDRATSKGTINGTSLDGTVDIETREVIREVTDGAMSDLEVTFVRGVTTGFDAGELTGLVVHVQPGKFTIDGQPATDAQFAPLRAYQRHDVGMPHWVQRALVEQTFIAGVETRVTAEGAIGDGGRPAMLAITLRSVHGGIADFALIETQQLGALIATTEHRVAIETSRGRLVSNRVHGTVSDVVFDEEEHFEYERPPPAPDPIARCDAPRTLHVPWRPPTVGETSQIHESSAYDFAGPAKHVHLATAYDSVDRVLAVSAGLIDDKESRVSRGRFESTEQAKPTDFTGDVFRMRIVDHKAAIMRNDQPVAKGDLVAGAVIRSDIHVREWTMRVVTDRSYEEGVEQHFPHEPIGIFGPGPSDLRVMLVGVEGDRATFKLAIKATVMVSDASMVMRVTGKLVLDTKRARVIALELHGRPEMKGLSGGNFELARTLVY